MDYLSQGKVCFKSRFTFFYTIRVTKFATVQAQQSLCYVVFTNAWFSFVLVETKGGGRLSLCLSEAHSTLCFRVLCQLLNRKAGLENEPAAPLMRQRSGIRGR